MSKPEWIERARVVAKEILDIELNENTKQELMSIFYEIMIKHNIKFGERTGENSITGANPEWTMYRDLYLQHIFSKLEWEFLMDIPPKNLEAY